MVLSTVKLFFLVHLNFIPLKTHNFLATCKKAKTNTLHTKENSFRGLINDMAVVEERKHNKNVFFGTIPIARHHLAPRIHELLSNKL